MNRPQLHPQKLLRTGLTAGLALILAISIAVAQSAVGNVMEIQGAWSVSGRPVVLGQPVLEGTLLTNPQPNEDDRIVVIASSGARVFTAECRAKRCYQCQAPGSCNDELRAVTAVRSRTAAAPEAEKTTWQVIWNSITQLFTDKPKKYAMARVRGNSIPDAVIRLGADQCELDPVLAGQDKGSYLLRFRSLPIEGYPLSEWSSDSVRVSWDPEKPPFVLVPGLHPGLFELTVTPVDSPDPTARAMTAWVIVAGADYAAIRDAWRSAETVSTAWGDDVSIETVQAFGRAALDHIAGKQLANKR